MSLLLEENKNEIKKYLEYIPKNSLSDNEHKEIALISFDKKHYAKRYGPSNYRSIPFPGDIELLEKYPYDHTGKSLVQVLKSFIKKLKEIVVNLPEFHYVCEFKAGLNKNFLIDIGNMSAGTYVPNSRLLEKLRDLVNDKKMPWSDYRIIESLLKYMRKNKNLNSEESSNIYDEIFSILRENRIVKWSKDEIIKEKKKMPGGETYSLIEALQDKSMVKLCLIVEIDGRMVEITNHITLAYLENGKIKNINEPLRISSSLLKQEVETLYYSNMYYDPIKCIMKMYTLTRINARNENQGSIVFSMLKKLTEILEGDVGRALQIKTFLSTLHKVVGNLPIKIIIDELQSLKKNYAYIQSLTKRDLNKINEIVDNTTKMDDNEGLESGIKELIKATVRLSNAIGIREMKLNNINPPPLTMLPLKMLYSPFVYRNEMDNPPKEYIEYIENIVLNEFEEKRVKFSKKRIYHAIPKESGISPEIDSKKSGVRFDYRVKYAQFKKNEPATEINIF